MARTQHLRIDRGEDLSLPCTIYTTDTGTTPEDITGWTFLFSISKFRNSPDKLIAKAGVIVTAASGTLTVAIDDTDTDNIEPGAYYWDLARTNAGYERTLVKGTFTIEGNARIPPAA